MDDGRPCPHRDQALKLAHGQAQDGGGFPQAADLIWHFHSGVSWRSNTPDHARARKALNAPEKNRLSL
jgi:hypothetical protein